MYKDYATQTGNAAILFLIICKKLDEKAALHENEM